MRAHSAVFLFATLLVSGAADARNLSDTWWAPDAAGWGLNVVHEGNLLSLTLFVHDAEGKPRWLTAALNRYGSTEAGDPEFAGTLFETFGTVPHVPWDPSAVESRIAGEIHFRARPGGRAELEYTLDGQPILRLVERFTTSSAKLEGLHFATLLPGYDSCSAGFQGLSVFERGTLQVELCDECDGVPEEGTPISLVLSDGSREICSITGAFSRYGVSGGIEGEYRCDDGGEGELQMRDIEFTSTGFTARFIGEHEQCAEFRGILSATRANAR